MESTNNSTILKNTILLYARMLVMLVIGLYTSRVLLATLGVEDFGLYNVVGGVIILTNVPCTFVKKQNKGIFLLFIEYCINVS